MPLAAYRVRNFEFAEHIEKVTALYQDRGGAFLPMPDAQELVDAGEDGRLFVVEKASGRDGGELFGAAGLFPLARCRHHESGPVIDAYEVAGMVLRGELGGFGLQSLLVALRTLSLAREADTNTVVLASVVEGNSRSLENLEASRFVRCEAPGWLKAAHRAWAPRTATILNFVLPPEALDHHAEVVTAAISDPVLRRRNKKTGRLEAIRIHLDVEWLTGERTPLTRASRGIFPAWERKVPEVRQLSSGSTWVDFRGDAIR